MASRIFLVTKPEDCAIVNNFCEKLDNKGTNYEIDYDDTMSDTNCFGYLVMVEWEN